MLRIVELLVLVALVSAQTAKPLSLIRRNPCSTWYPLGGNSQDINNLPYTALCSVSPDNTQLIMQIASKTGTGVMTGVVATAVHDNNNGWTDPAGVFKPPAAGYTVATCADGSASVVKDDFSPVNVFSQAWNIPPTAQLSDVKCRFMIAESEKIYWNDIILPADTGVVQQQTTFPPVTAESVLSKILTGSPVAASDSFPDLFPTFNGNDTNSTEPEFTFSPGAETSTAILVGDGLETTTQRAVLPKAVPKTVNGVPTNYWCDGYGSFYALVPGTQCSSYYTGAYHSSIHDMKPVAKLHCVGGTKFSTITCGCDWTGKFFCPELM